MAGENPSGIEEISLAVNAAGIGRNEKMSRPLPGLHNVAALLRNTKRLGCTSAQVTGQTGDNTECHGREARWASANLV